MTVVTYQGVVYPAQCDAMGHMNVQYYVAAFDQSLWHLMAAVGYSHVWITERKVGWADRRYEIDFRRELSVGSLFSIESHVVKVGGTSLTTRHIVSETGTGVINAELVAVSVYFDLAKRQAISLPDELRCVAEELIRLRTY